MKLTKKLILAICALFNQSNSCIKAMEIQPYQVIFNQPDIMTCVVEKFDTPLTSFYNLCLTNKDLYKNWDNINFWKQICNQTGYFKKEYLDQDQSNPFLYRPLLLDIEEDIFQLMGISMHIIREENRRKENKRYIPNEDDVNDFASNDPYEIEIRTCLEPCRILELLSKIRTREKQVYPEFPLNSKSIFSLDKQVKLWESEGVFLSYLIGHRNIPKSESDKKFDLAFNYLNIIFPLELKELPYFTDPNSKKIFQLYWFTMLTQSFFQNHPKIGLFFGLIARKEMIFYLVDSKTDKVICHEKFEEFSNQFKDNNIYLGEKFVVNMEELCLRRQESLRHALDQVPEAWDLYQEHLKYEAYDTEEIEGLSKPY